MIITIFIIDYNGHDHYNFDNRFIMDMIITILIIDYNVHDHYNFDHRL